MLQQLLQETSDLIQQHLQSVLMKIELILNQLKSPLLVLEIVMK
jgi:hypothetical protein